MVQVNDYLKIHPIQHGMIASEGNEYLVLDAPIRHTIDETDYKNYNPGDTVIVEDHLVIRVSIGGKESFFVKQENVLVKIDGPKKDN